MFLLSFVFLVVFGVTNTAHAQGDWWDKGNGGFVLACSGQKLRTFDLYELQSRYEDQMSLDRNFSASLDQRVNYLLDKVAVLNPARALKYRKWFLEFFNELQFTNNSLQANPDIGFGQVPIGCTLELAVFQRNPGIINRYRYTVRKTLWERLDVIEQAALVLHELIYREAAQQDNQHQTSERSRFFNAWINSEEFSKTSIQEYLFRLQLLHFRDAEYGSHQIYLGLYNEDKKSWDQYDLSFFDSGVAGVITVDSKDPAASQLISSYVRSCLEEKRAVGPLFLDESGRPSLWKTTLPNGEICPFQIQNANFDNPKGYSGTILGSQFHFYDQHRMEVSGTYDFPNRFFFNRFRFDLLSPTIQIRHLLNGEHVELIVFSDVNVCRSKVAQWIQVTTSKSGTIEFYNFDDLMSRVPECL
ncbi:hypothetical protein D3C87_1139980 [compost metagenome]